MNHRNFDDFTHHIPEELYGSWSFQIGYTTGVRQYTKEHPDPGFTHYRLKIREDTRKSGHELCGLLFLAGYLQGRDDIGPVPPLRTMGFYKVPRTITNFDVMCRNTQKKDAKTVFDIGDCIKYEGYGIYD